MDGFIEYMYIRNREFKIFGYFEVVDVNLDIMFVGCVVGLFIYYGWGGNG